MLHPIPPYNFDLVLDLLARYAYPTVDVVHDGAYWRVVSVDDALALICVRSRGTLHAPALEVSLAAAVGEVENLPLLEAAGHILGVTTDPNGFYTFAKSDGDLWEIIGPLVGLRWLRTASVFEALMTTIIEQQISWVSAQRAQRWLVEWGGNRVDYNGSTHYAFPTPQQLASAAVDDLVPLKITFKRMRVMLDIANSVISGELDLEALRHMPVDEAYKVLTGIKGVGHWTAAWTLQRVRGEHNYVGHNDVALQAAVNHYFYGGTGRIPAEQVLECFGRYGDFAGMVAHYTIIRWVLDRYEPR
jgi:DNA-3-methyladenine glycosylase II